MKNSNYTLGIDVGSIAVALATVPPDKRIVQTAYGFHHGNIRQTLERLLADFDLIRVGQVAATRAAAPHPAAPVTAAAAADLPEEAFFCDLAYQ